VPASCSQALTLARSPLCPHSGSDRPQPTAICLFLWVCSTQGMCPPHPSAFRSYNAWFYTINVLHMSADLLCCALISSNAFYYLLDKAWSDLSRRRCWLQNFLCNRLSFPVACHLWQGEYRTEHRNHVVLRIKISTEWQRQRFSVLS